MYIYTIQLYYDHVDFVLESDWCTTIAVQCARALYMFVSPTFCVRGAGHETNLSKLAASLCLEYSTSTVHNNNHSK